MSFERFNTLLASPLASLFLIVLLCTVPVAQPTSVGVRMPVLRLRPPLQGHTCDGRPIFVQFAGDGIIDINFKHVPEQKLSGIVGDQMLDRAERVVFLVPSPEISFSRFVGTLNLLQSSPPFTHVGIIPAAIRKEFFAGTAKANSELLDLPCRLEFPASESLMPN